VDIVLRDVDGMVIADLQWSIACGYIQTAVDKMKQADWPEALSESEAL
jgi:hypothetical protein